MIVLFWAIALIWLVPIALVATALFGCAMSGRHRRYWRRHLVGVAGD
jgi:hypothetical protein